MLGAAVAQALHISGTRGSCLTAVSHNPPWCEQLSPLCPGALGGLMLLLWMGTPYLSVEAPPHTLYPRGGSDPGSQPWMEGTHRPGLPLSAVWPCMVSLLPGEPGCPRGRSWVRVDTGG